MKWYQVKVRIDRPQNGDSGLLKPKSETYLVEATSFAEAELVVMQEVGKSSPNGLDVTSIARKSYAELITGEEAHNRWFKCRVNFITFDEKSGIEKKMAQHYLVDAETTTDAQAIVDNFMGQSLGDYEVDQIEDTKVLDVFRLR